MLEAFKIHRVSKVEATLLSGCFTAVMSNFQPELIQGKATPFVLSNSTQNIV